MRSCLLNPLVWMEVEHQIIRTLGHRMDWVGDLGIPRSLTPASGTSFYSRVSNNTKQNSEMKHIRAHISLLLCSLDKKVRHMCTDVIVQLTLIAASLSLAMANIACLLWKIDDSNRS